MSRAASSSAAGGSSSNPVEEYFARLLDRLPNFFTVFVCDMAGGEVCRVTLDSATTEEGLESTLAASLNVITEQANKLRLGQLQSLVASYDSFTVVYISSSSSAVATFYRLQVLRGGRRTGTR
eukprot:EC794227.1.p2 GENE.EC794227.1~~EC794227.1.p2  ORF type:complete len:123 (+),score=33.13 EC794227.1:84-452(+)